MTHNPSLRKSDDEDKFSSIEQFVDMEEFHANTYPGKDSDDLLVHAGHLRAVIPEITTAMRNAVLDEVERRVLHMISREERNTDMFDISLGDEVRAMFEEMRDGK